MRRDRLVLCVGLGLGAVAGALAFRAGVNLPLSIAVCFLTASISNLIATITLLR